MNGCIYRTKDNECDLWTTDKTKSFCDIENCKEKKPSNADHIRAMGDEELAEWVMRGLFFPRCPVIRCPTDKDCKKCWLDWLKDEVKE